MATDPWGIDDGYHDTVGGWHPTPVATTARFHTVMGADDAPSGPPEDAQPYWSVAAGSAPSLDGPVDLVLEDGTTVRADGWLPPDLPLGYHDLWPLDTGATRPANAWPTRLVVHPGRVAPPPAGRTWGVAAQLYAARSQQSWGIGDLADLATLAGRIRQAGGRTLGLNPLHAAQPIARQQPSPYYPSSRRWMNPLYLCVEAVPGAEREPGLASLAAAGQALNTAARIDRDAIWHLKADALDGIWSRFEGDPDFDAYCAEHGRALDVYATYCALAEHHGRGWRSWPHQHRRPDAPGVAAFADEHADRVAFHVWLQYLLDRQLHDAGARDLTITDLAVGFDPDGADAWEWQDLLADGVSIGAPPDEFNTQGQDWGLPPFVPWRLRAAGYEPFAQTLRANLRHGCGLRVDHVMGLFRLFWVPAGDGPRAGGYVRFAGRELLDVVCLEAARAGTFVVGEDLGTVEPEVRSALGEAGVLSTRVLWFEGGSLDDLPEQALATVTTHDLPTVAGLWTGADLAMQERLDLRPNVEGTHELRRHLAELGGLPDDASPHDAVTAAHRAISASPAAIAMGTLDDVVVAVERPNVPGTTTERPNWCIPLPVPLDDLDATPGVAAAIDALRGQRDAGGCGARGGT